jgi:membrane protease YdiL (CAAX protease family)
VSEQDGSNKGPAASGADGAIVFGGATGATGSGGADGTTVSGVADGAIVPGGADGAIGAGGAPGALDSTGASGGTVVPPGGAGAADSPLRKLPELGPVSAVVRIGAIYVMSGALVVGLRAALGFARPAAVPLAWSPVELGWGVAGVFAYLLYNLGMPQLVLRLPGGKLVLSWMSRRSLMLFGKLPLPTLLAMALLAGVCEEIVFRGWLQAVAGLWLTSFIFSLAHFPPTAYRWRHPVTWGMVALYFPVSLAIGALFDWRGNLLAPIVTHMVSDALGLLLIVRVLAARRRDADAPAAAPQASR